MLLRIILPFCLVFFIASQALAQAPVGSVTELEGTARLWRRKQEFKVAIKMAVIARDSLQTMPKSHLTVTLNGGSRAHAGGVEHDGDR